MSLTVDSTCPYCGVGCGVTVTPSSEGIQVAADPSHPSNLGRMCSKGAHLADTVGLNGRILHPSVAGERASWDTALDTVATGLNAIIEEHGPDAVALYVSGQLLTEDYYAANKLMKGFIGSANIDANSRLCMASAVAGYQRTLGSDTVPADYADAERADLLVCVGANMAWCHPVLFQRVVAARTADPSKRLVVIDPRRTATARSADLHLPLAPGTDTILFSGLLAFLADHGAVDLLFLERHASGWGAAITAAREAAPSVVDVARRCGLSAEAVLTFYRWYAESRETVSTYSMGTNQASDGTDRVTAIIQAHLATGRIARPGCGPLSLTGQPNAMGGREVGALANLLAAHLQLGNADDTALLSRFWQTDTVATQVGLKTVDMFDAVLDGRIKAIWIMATNPVVSVPRADRVKAALQAAELVVVSECYASSETLDYADVVLPAAPWGEKDGTVTNSERRISRCRSFREPAGEARPDWSIIADVASRMGHGAAFAWAGPHEVFDEHARLSAFHNEGTRSFDLTGLVGMDKAAYDAMAPTQWPVPAKGPQGVVFADNQFSTPDGRAQFQTVTPRPPAVRVDRTYPLVLNTGRLRDQWHTMTRTARSPALAAHEPEPFAEIHRADAAKHALVDGTLVRVCSPHGTAVVRARVSAEHRQGSVFVPMHWSSPFASQAAINASVHGEVDPVSAQPDFKRTPCRIEPVSTPWHALVLTRTEVRFDETVHWSRTAGKDFHTYRIDGLHEVDDPCAWTQAQVEQAGITGASWAEYRDPNRGRFHAVCTVDNAVHACVYIGPRRQLPDATWLAEVFGQSTLSRLDHMALMVGRPSGVKRYAGPTICVCHQISAGRITEAVTSEGCTSVAAIGERTGAGTSCGSCRPEIAALIARSVPSPQEGAA